MTLKRDLLMDLFISSPYTLHTHTYIYTNMLKYTLTKSRNCLYLWSHLEYLEGSWHIIITRLN